jgi:hypothetical protein
MKTIFGLFLFLQGAVAFADYSPTITCKVHGVQTAAHGAARFDTANAMYWDSAGPGETMLDYRFHRINNSPNELSFRLEASDNSLVLAATLRKGQSVEWSAESGPVSTSLKFSCE